MKEEFYSYPLGLGSIKESNNVFFKKKQGKKERRRKKNYICNQIE